MIELLLEEVFLHDVENEKSIRFQTNQFFLLLPNQKDLKATFFIIFKNQLILFNKILSITAKSKRFKTSHLIPVKGLRPMHPQAVIEALAPIRPSPIERSPKI